MMLTSRSANTFPPPPTSSSLPELLPPSLYFAPQLHECFAVGNALGLPPLAQTLGGHGSCLHAVGRHDIGEECRFLGILLDVDDDSNRLGRCHKANN